MRRRRTAQEIEELLEVPDQRNDAGCILSAGGDRTQHSGSISSATERQAATGKSEAGCSDGSTPVVRACAEQRAADRERWQF